MLFKQLPRPIFKFGMATRVEQRDEFLLRRP
jgi:hypothetical protein